MSEFEVFVLGVGDTMSELYRPSALLLVCDGFRLAIDCPDLYRHALRATSAASGTRLSLDDIDDVLVTHVHGDHMNGVEAVAFYKRFVQSRPLRLVSSREVRDVIWDERLRGSMKVLWNGSEFRSLDFDDYFQWQELAWDGPTRVGPFEIHARRTRHHVPTSALRVAAGGRTLGYSCDTAFDPSLIAWLEDADLIIHETSFGPAHTPYLKLAELPEPLRAKMRLIHYPDGIDAAWSAIAPLREGERLVV